MWKTSSSTDRPPRFTDKQVFFALLVVFIITYSVAGLFLGWLGISP